MKLKRETLAKSTSLEMYLSEINQYPLLTVQEEQALARTYREKGDTRAAHRLVTANLRFVVKVAFEYRSYGFNMAELVQEGNTGLVKAVEKFDPDKNIRLISYAVWWIRAYIQNWIMKSWSLVKLGTTQAQRKLFFSLARTRRDVEKDNSDHNSDSGWSETAEIAGRLKVKKSEVDEMTQRMNARDVSLDVPLGDDGGSSHGDSLPGSAPTHEEDFSTAQEQWFLQDRVREALARLDPRERYIVEQRIMSDDPMTLRDVGAHFGFSRERARQLEMRAMGKLKEELQSVAAEVDWPITSDSSGQSDPPPN